MKNPFAELPPVPYLEGLHYAVRILLGTAIVWVLMEALGIGSPVWGLITVIVVSEPHMKNAWTTFLSRFINTLVGSAMGLVFLLGFGPHADFLPIAAALTALASIYLTRMMQGWRIGPVTTAIVISSALVDPAHGGVLSVALDRTVSVLIGSVVALAVTYLMALVWIPEADRAGDDGKAS
ncbi:MAG: FUSC family protein [Alphaproteobacteria bacterium]